MNRLRVPVPNWSFVGGVLLASTLYTIYNLLSLRRSASESLRRKKVLLFGDSITQHGWNTEIKGWACALAHHWFRRVDIFNRGYSGYNSRWAVSLLKEVVLDEKPNFITVFFGANDAVDPSVLQHVPLAEYDLNMRKIVLAIKQSLPSIPLVIITPPPVWEKKLEEMNAIKKKPLLRDRTNERTLQYAEVCKRMCSEYDLPCVDLWTGLEGGSEARQLYLSDGLHLNDRGNQRLFELLVASVNERFPQWRLENMPLDQPEWSLMGERFKQ